MKDMLVSFFTNYTILYEIFCFMNTLRIVSFINYPKVYMYIIKMNFVFISGIKDLTKVLRNLQLSVQWRNYREAWGRARVPHMEI